MWKWILAAVGVVVLSMAISATYMQLSRSPPRNHYDAAAFERQRQIDLQYEPISLVSLLAAPERYDGHKVLVSGFVTLNFEDAGLHLDKGAYEAGLRRNAVWLDRPAWLSATEQRRLNRRYGEVAATFDASRRGHMGAYTGALTQLRRIEPTLTQSDYQRLRLRENREVLLQAVFSGRFLTLIGWASLAVWALVRRGARAR